MGFIIKTSENEDGAEESEPPHLDLVEIAKTLQKDPLEEMKKKPVEEDRNPSKEFKEYKEHNTGYYSDKKYTNDLELLTFKDNFEMRKPKF